VMILISCYSTPQIVSKPEISTEASKETPADQRDFHPTLNGKRLVKGISYGCYREGQAPHVKGPSEAEILEDLTIISQYWNLIRVYGSDDDSERVLKVIKDNDIPVKLMLGIWLANETADTARKILNQAEVTRSIQLANDFPDEVVGINVGNESQVYWSAHKMESKNLIKYIRQVRAHTSVPIATADDYNFWNKPEAQQIAAELDYFVLHAYATWNGQVLEHAVQWTDSVYQDIAARYPDMNIVLGEMGWPTEYNPDNKGPGAEGTLFKGEISLEAQEEFLVGINQWIDKRQVTTFLFEAFDEPWKGGGEHTPPNVAEKHWGVFYENRTPKPSFKNYLISATQEPK